MRIVKTLSACLAVIGVAASAAHAQFSNYSEAHSAPTGQPSFEIKSAQLSVLVSPYTTFERTYAAFENNSIVAHKQVDKGVLLSIEQFHRNLSDLPTANNSNTSSSTLGAYYWYNSKHRDNYAAYYKYFPTSKIGGQVTIGGDTKLGINEYYLFVLYNALVADPKHKLAVQVGAGPYFPRQELGKGGWNYILGASYGFSPEYSAVASLWYVDFENSFPQYGFNTRSTTARFSLGIAHPF